MKEQLTKFSVRIRLIEGETTLSIGSGTLIFSNGKYYVFTACHCVYGDNGKYKDIAMSNVVVETQTAFNAAFIRQKVNGVVGSCPVKDWALLDIDQPDYQLPTAVNVSNFKIDTIAQFRGFQKVVENEGRTFECIVKDPPSNNEFKVTLGIGEQFNSETENAKGLSGSGVFVIQNGQLHLLGALKSVKGPEAKNDDILCCSIEVIREFLPDTFTVLQQTDLDITAADQYEVLATTDARNFSDKVLAVCPQINPHRIKSYSSDIVLGNAELAIYDQRAISAMKFRIFKACQEELIDYLEDRQEEAMTSQEIKALIEKYTDRAVKIITTKSESYSYPIKDRDIIGKIVLDLIDQCFLSFDKQGLYEY
jgi:hypothetical protein